MNRPGATRSPKDARRFEQRWRAKGGRVEKVRRTGEVRYTHPALPKPIRANGRRKDVPRKLTTAFGKI